jgi:cyclopropane-fatty-acyl-phospholipid synthase
MAENFFTGGQMPSDDLLLHFQGALALEDHWVLPGGHYEKTCNAWLEKMDAHKREVLPLLERVYGSAEEARRRFIDWRLFFIACAELFGHSGGNEWAVSHYLFSKK